MLGEPALQAEAAIDRITSAAREHERRRPRALSAREALLALQFEATLVAVISRTLLDGRPMSDADHERLVVAVGRINVIVDEAAG